MNQKEKQKNNYEKVILLILDGFGVNPKIVESPWKMARTPNFKEIEKYYPFTVLQASGNAVGLPFKEEGNSEVGHLTIGAGRVIYSHLPRISFSIKDGSFLKNPAFLKAAEKAKSGNSKLHLIGLFSSGSVHAFSEHLYALLDFAKQNNISKTFLHLFTDGKDSAINEAAEFINFLENKLNLEYKNIKIASLIGRDFAMDRDRRWEKIEKTYNLYTKGEGEKIKSASEFLSECYVKGITDEFIPPAVISENQKFPGIIQSGDAVIFFNFREDSMRELVSAFYNTEFNNFKRDYLRDLLIITMTEYQKEKGIAAFPQFEVKNILSEVISESGLSQFHIAETEKYAHVTYFFNGWKEAAFKREDRYLVPSLRNLHFEDTPEMMANKITEIILNILPKYNFILANFANADLVGHTGNFEATKKAFEALDSCVGIITKKILDLNSVLIITGDHGNAEEKLYGLSGEKKTKHSINPVPFYLIAQEFRKDNTASEEDIAMNYKRIKGALTDIAPTILELMGIEKPAEMTGMSLLKSLL